MLIYILNDKLCEYSKKRQNKYWEKSNQNFACEKFEHENLVTILNVNFFDMKIYVHWQAGISW